MKPTLGVLLVLTILNGTTHAGEPVSVSGTLESSATGYSLRDSNSRLVANLQDPRGLLHASKRRVTLQTETTLTRAANGLPTLVVINLLPEHWTQPSIWTPEQQQAGNYSGYPGTRQAKDFAGVPFTTYRSHQHDNGLENLRITAPSVTEPPVHPPLRLLNPRINPREFLGSFEGRAGFTYQLQFRPTLDDLPVTLSTLTASADGVLSIAGANQGGQMGFYLLRAVPPVSP